MKAQLRSPFQYPGAKINAAGIVGAVALKPGTPTCVVDAFTGGGSLLLHFAEACPGARLVANDTSRPVAAFWRCVTDATMAERLCTALPDKVTTEYAKDARRSITDTDLDDVTMAAVGIVRSRTAHQGIMLKRSGILGGVDGKNVVALSSRYNAGVLRDRIRRIAAAVAGRLVVHEEDFQAVIQRYDQPGTLLLLDPPYVGLGTILYENGFGEADHHRLADCLKGLEHAAWVMTNGVDSLTYRLYSDQDVVTMPLRLHGAHGSRLERVIAPKAVVWPDGSVKRVPVTDLQRKADVLAVHGHGPQIKIAVPPKQGRKPTKAVRTRQGKPKTPVVKPLTRQETNLLADCEAAIDEAMHGILEGFVSIGYQLVQIGQHRLYRDRYPTFAGYCEGRWRMSPSRAYQLMRGVVAFEAIKVQFARRKGREEAMTQGLVPANEAQIRSLVPLLGGDDKAGRKAVCAVWKRVLARTAAGESLTAALVSEEVTRWNGKQGVEQRASWDYEASPLGNLHPLELRIRRATSIEALNSAMAQLQELLKLLEDQRAQLAAGKPQESAPA